MKRKLTLSSLALAGALTGLTTPIGASTPSDAGVGMGETSQQKSQQGVGLEGANSSNVVLGGPEIVLGRIEKIDATGFLVHGDRGQFMKLQMGKDTNIVCAAGSQSKMVTGRQGRQEQTEIPISPATEEQMKSYDPSRIEEQLTFLNDPNRQQTEFETSAPSKDPSTLKGVVGSTDEANKDMAHGSGFVVGDSDCNFKPGDLVRIEASDMGTMTTIKKLASAEDESGSQIAAEKEEELSTSTQ
jgi:hypothetical protein